ncbi:MAG TPA: TetR/AcrR family transcriptional regulator [Arachidicoccus sp.]|nr:TetR/AcrR family transcriptional regulator [Arachidicoccus sp.]
MARTKEFDENKILEKAMNLFWARGFNSTSAQDLVEGLGISRSSLYDTFGNKHQLFIRSLEYYRETMSRRLIEMINASTNIEGTIWQIFMKVTHESLTDKLSKGCLMVNSTIELSPHDTQIATIVAANTQDIEDSLRLLIKKGQQSGTFPNTLSARSLSRFLYNSIRGLRVLAKSKQLNPEVFDDIVSMTLSVLKK